MYLKMKRLLKELTVLLISVFLYHGNLSGQADFEQTDDEDGLVIMEAEDFSDALRIANSTEYGLVLCRLPMRAVPISQIIRIWHMHRKMPLC